MKVISSTQVRLKFTDPSGKFRTPVITKPLHGLVVGDPVVVLVSAKSPYTFVAVSKPNSGGNKLPDINVENKAPMLPMADIPDAFEKQSKLTYSIAPDIDDGPTIIPGYVKTSCLMECVKKCGKQNDDNKDSNFVLSASTKMPLPLPMAPRETFADMFLQRNFLNQIDDQNVNYGTGMDYSVDYEVSTTPFVQTKIVPPGDLGDSIPERPDVRVPKNQVLAMSDPIVPTDSPDIVKSRSDTPIVDMIANGSASIGNKIGEYAKMVGAWISQYYSSMPKNDDASISFKYNSKIVAFLIALAVVSFLMNSGISAIAVSAILAIAITKVGGIF
jgi:hypothetical protein